MRIALILPLIFCLQYTHSQTVVINDSLEIEFKKTKTISNSYLHSSIKMKKTEDVKRILVRCDLNSLVKKPVDINAFSLIDIENKIRYRIASYFGYKKGPSLITNGDLGRVHLKKEVLNKRGKQFKFLPPYDESMLDSFETYNFEDYTNVEIPMRYYNVVSGEVISIIYFSPSQRTNFRADMQFVVFTNRKPPKLKLYYGKEFISEIEFDN